MLNSFRPSRRRFLRGAGGLTLGLPLLDAFAPRAARGAAPAKPVFGVIVVEMNGVQQGDMGNMNEPRAFWPTKIGPLTKASMQAEPGQATSVLADYADKLLMVRNVRLPFSAEGCAHSSDGNMLLTAQKFGPAGSKSQAFGESVDNYVGRITGREPWNLYAGPKYGYIDDHISYRGKSDVRVGENNPWLAYQKLVGMTSATASNTAAQIAAGKKSVNDFLRAELNELRGRTDLSSDDKRRLDLHFDAIRDLEIKVTTDLPDQTKTDLKSVDGAFRTDANRLKVVRLQYDLAAFALASGYSQIVVLQIGDGTDGMQYVVDGMTLPRFHPLSHRATSDSTVGDSPDKDKMIGWHHKIDILRLELWRHLLDAMSGYTTPDGNLLDVGFSLWTNTVATGDHRSTNMPFLFAGKARGFFKTGQHVSANGKAPSDSPADNAPNNQILSTVINAFGIRKADGSMVDDFGDPSLPKGVVSSMIA